MDDSPFTLNTNRLHLRHFHPNDAQPMLAIFGDPEVMHFGSGVHALPWIRDWIQRQRAIYSEHPGYGLWAVVEQATAQAIGYCGLTRFPDIGGQPETEVGYRLARSHWGQGLATEAAMAVRDHALHTLGLPRLIALIDPANLASLRVAEKLGMRYEKDATLPGYSHPDRVYVVETNSEPG